MSFRKEVRGFIAEWQYKVRHETIQQSMIDVLKSELANSRKTNKDLLDRLMARNFEELKVYQESNEIDSFVEKNLDPQEDETNAGEII